LKVGVLTTAMLLGPATMTLAIGLIAHRLRTVRLLTSAATLMVLSGIGYALETEFWPLLVIALVGTLSPTASDVSVFAPLEQTLLSNAVLPERRTSIFASYSLIGSVLGAVRCLFASVPEIVGRISLIPPNRALQGMFLIYAFLGAFAFVIYRHLKSPAEIIVSTPKIGPLGPSRRIVLTLAALFSLDSFGGGFFVQSLLAYGRCYRGTDEILVQLSLVPDDVRVFVCFGVVEPRNASGLSADNACEVGAEPVLAGLERMADPTGVPK